jgi:hypothetical protein
MLSLQSVSNNLTTRHSTSILAFVWELGVTPRRRPEAAPTGEGWHKSQRYILDFCWEPALLWGAGGLSFGKLFEGESSDEQDYWN